APHRPAVRRTVCACPRRVRRSYRSRARHVAERSRGAGTRRCLGRGRRRGDFRVRAAVHRARGGRSVCRGHHVDHELQAAARLPGGRCQHHRGNDRGNSRPGHAHRQHEDERHAHGLGVHHPGARPEPGNDHHHRQSQHPAGGEPRLDQRRARRAHPHAKGQLHLDAVHGRNGHVRGGPDRNVHPRHADVHARRHLLRPHGERHPHAHVL
ncbi:MAG: hypothetical protein AVDCRST_MAG89-1766, partial [uncultured Gemmatimonadetes bacterium]